uniref:Uncharacterized protein n=1 Tax=Lactuca sativa TaxID=4236 RepID=A0A9R1UKG0_LACSA|nr:hypothetical protein LSAT_V11C900456990 [Lactuca sativa]
MVITRNNLGSSGTSDEEICRIIHEEVAATIKEAIPNMFGSIKTTLIETFDERYTAVTEAVAAATATIATARPQGGDSLLFCEFSNTKPPEFDGTQDPIAAMRWISNIEGCFYTCSCPYLNMVGFRLYITRGVKSKDTVLPSSSLPFTVSCHMLEKGSAQGEVQQVSGLTKQRVTNVLPFRTLPDQDFGEIKEDEDDGIGKIFNDGDVYRDWPADIDNGSVELSWWLDVVESIKACGNEAFMVVSI